MGEFHYMPMFWSQFFADTEHLSEDAAKAHLFLIGHAWIRGARLPDNDAVLARLSRISPRRWAAIKSDVLSLWTKQEDGHLSQKRMAEEFKNTRARAEKNKQNGSKGGRPKNVEKTNEIKQTENPVGLVSDTQTEPILKLNLNTDIVVGSKDPPTRPKRVRTRPNYSGKFEEFWRSYPTDANMSKSDAFGQWQRLSEEDQEAAIASCPAYRAFCASNATYRPKHAQGYLSGRRFDGHGQTAMAVSKQVFVRIGTPQWDSWERYYRRTKNMSPPTNKEGTGWSFPFEWASDMPAKSRVA